VEGELPSLIGVPSSRLASHSEDSSLNIKEEADWQCVLISGPAGAGKTTAARRVAEMQVRPSVHLCLDYFRESVASGFAEPLHGWSVEAARQYSLAQMACASVAHIYVDAGFSCVIDDAIFPALDTVELLPASNAAANTGHAADLRLLTDPSFPNWRQWEAALKGLDLRLVVLLPSLDCVIQRSAKRSGRGNIEPAMLTVIHELMLPWAKTDAHVLDNSDLTPEETALRISALL
jgi:chloramphenicol 3-O-phosphotransferase